jgi:hypothetical protein
MSAYEPPQNYEPPETALSPEDRQRVAAMLARGQVSPLEVLGQSFASDPDEIWDPNAAMAIRETTIAQADIDTDARIIAERIYDRMAERIPGWVAHDSELATILIDEFSTVAAEIRQEAVNVPESIYVTYGAEVLGIPIAPPEPATGTATFTAIDALGYTVTPALQFTLARTGDELVVFEVIAGAVIPAGERSVSGVQIRAAEPGANGNDLSGPGDPVDPLIWIESIEVENPTAFGSNGQTNDEYLSDLIGLLRVIALRPVLPWDFAILALRVSGVGRAVAMDGYRPEVTFGDADAVAGARAELTQWLSTHAGNADLLEARAIVSNAVATMTPDEGGGTWGHARTVTLILTDEHGEPCPLPVKAAVRNLLEALREVNWRVFIVDPDYVEVDVGYEVTAFAEQNPELVGALADAAIIDALDPAKFRLGTTSPAIAAGEVIPPPEEGLPPGRQTLRVNDFIGLLDRVRGVDWVDWVTLDGDGDFRLAGPTTLPRVGAISGRVNVQ